MVKSKRMRWAGLVARMGVQRNSYRLLVENPQEKRLLGKPRRKKVDTIRTNLGEILPNGVDWIGLA
jgi:hypothetical protein